VTVLLRNQAEKRTNYNEAEENIVVKFGFISQKKNRFIPIHYWHYCCTNRDSLISQSEEVELDIGTLIMISCFLLFRSEVYCLGLFTNSQFLSIDNFAEIIIIFPTITLALIILGISVSPVFKEDGNRIC